MRKKILAVALIVIGFASIAYAAFTQTLTVSGTGTASGSWNVAITGITQSSATGATDNTTPSYTGTSATFDVNLAYPGATATYDVTIKNTGSIPATLTSITDLATINASAPTYITYSMSGVTAGSTTLAAGATNTLHVTVAWDAASSPSTSSESKAATITLNYSQSS